MAMTGMGGDKERLAGGSESFTETGRALSAERSLEGTGGLVFPLPKHYSILGVQNLTCQKFDSYEYPNTIQLLSVQHLKCQKFDR